MLFEKPSEYNLENQSFISIIKKLALNIIALRLSRLGHEKQLCHASRVPRKLSEAKHPQSYMESPR